MKIKKQIHHLSQSLAIQSGFRPLLLIMLLPCLFACTVSDDKQSNESSSLSLAHGLKGYAGGFVPNGNSHDPMIGAPGASGGKGALLVYTAQDTHNFTYIEGESSGDWFGSSFAALGDIAGSGKQYFAVGALFATGDAPVSGTVYVYERTAEGGQLVAKLKGENAFDKFGYAITAGDLNHDGKQDIIVSAVHTYTETGYQSGAVYVYFGGATLSGNPDVKIAGDKVNAGIGLAVAAGDINGDNIADLLIGASPKVFVYYGGSDFETRLDASSVPSMKFSGTSSTTAKDGSGFGSSISWLDDINGDDIGDVAIANPNRSVPTDYDNVGSVYVFKGAANLPAEVLENNLSYRLAKITGCSMADRFGSSIAYAGGTTKDLLVGTRWSLHPDSAHMVTGNVYRFPLATLMADNTQTYAVANATHAYPLLVDESDGEYGRNLDVAGEYFLAGAPHRGSEIGDAFLINLANGVPAVCGAANVGGGGDDHEH